VRAVLDEGDRLGTPEVLLSGIPYGAIHDGGRLAFGPDGYLYASTGETGQGELAQDRDSLGGKILRITTDGDPAPGNPDPGSPIWSYGHRNVQGLAFDDRGRLWASEFGQSTFDELNQIQPDGNYGWPEAEGRDGSGSFVNPRVVWNPEEASPSGLAFTDGHLWLAALRGTRLWRIEVDGSDVGKVRDFFVGDYGRLRTIAVAPDGMLWVTTSNRDGRGEPTEGDDRILVVDPG
jgi:glucose/arabinose dehydrogenase